MQQQNQLVLSKGLEVEVTSKEEGFIGAWYTATIIEPPSSSPSRKARNQVALVEYHNLVTEEDSSKPLREYTSLALIRPLPPRDAENSVRMFEEGDIVDAFYHDGWWTGTVCRVLKGGGFMVFYESPPDVMEFEVSNLRVHQEWVDGKWVRPEKQQTQQISKSNFSAGQEVEVNFDEETSSDIWFAAIFIKKFQESYLVKYKSSQDGNEFGFLKVMVDSLHVRPIPPPCVDRDYELLEEVEVFYEFGWRIGQITKVLADRKYKVFFKLSDESVKLDHTKLRPHMRWIDGKWIGTSETVTSTKVTNERKGMPPNLELNMPKGSPAGKVGRRGAAAVALICANEAVTSESGPIIRSMPGAEEAAYRHEKVNSNNKKRRRQSKSNITSSMTLEKGYSSKKAVKKCLTSCNTKEHEMADAGSPDTPTDENMPLRILFGSAHTKTSELLSCRKADQHKESPQVKTPLEFCSDNNVSDRNTFSPFAKRSPAWKKLESMKVFEMMPQTPHFLPLSKCEEKYREANAIGMMFTFACTAEMVSELKFDDPRSTFTSALESLLDLENHGFDVDHLRTRIRELLGIRDKLSLLQEEARVAETRITELTQDRLKFSDEVEKIEMEITELQKMLHLAKSRMEKACNDIASLRSDVKAINAVIGGYTFEFNKLCSPF